MSVRRILAKTIDTDLEYEAIGIDLAKNCVSAALLTTDSEVVCIVSQDTVLEQHSLFRGTGYDFLNLVSRASPLFRETV